MTPSAKAGTRPLQRRRSRLLLVLLLLCGLLLALEVAARLVGIVDLSRGVATPHQAAFNAAGLFESAEDAALSYRNRPFASATIDGIEYRHDAHGWRELPEVAQAAAGAAPAVVFLGDSTTYGLGLRAAETLPSQVAEALRAGGAGPAIRPLNLGVCGYGTGQEAALYAASRTALDALPGQGPGERGLVVLVFFPNDFARGTFLWDSELAVMYVDPLPLPFALKGWLWRSELYRALVSRVGNGPAAVAKFDAANPANHPQALAAVEQLARLVAADGRQLVVAALPAMERLDPYLFEGPVAQLAQTCRRLGVPFVNLLPAFLAERTLQIARYEQQSGRSVDAVLRQGFLAQYWIDDPRDHHLNAAATRLAAEALAAAIAPLIPER